MIQFVLLLVLIDGVIIVDNLAVIVYSKSRDGDQGPFLFKFTLQTSLLLENDRDYMFLARMYGMQCVACVAPDGTEE